MLEQERLKLDFDVTLYNCLFEVMKSVGVWNESSTKPKGMTKGE